MKVSKLIVLATALLFAAVVQAAPDATFSINRNLQKIYQGADPIALKYRATVEFTGLTVEARQRLQLPTTKPNPAYDPDVEGSEPEIPCTDADTTQTMVYTQHMPYSEDVTLIKSTIVRRMQRMKQMFVDRWVTTAPETVQVPADENFVD